MKKLSKCVCDGATDPADVMASSASPDISTRSPSRISSTEDTSGEMAMSLALSRPLIMSPRDSITLDDLVQVCRVVAVGVTTVWHFTDRLYPPADQYRIVTLSGVIGSIGDVLVLLSDNGQRGANLYETLLAIHLYPELCQQYPQLLVWESKIVGHPFFPCLRRDESRLLLSCWYGNAHNEVGEFHALVAPLVPA